MNNTCLQMNMWFVTEKVQRKNWLLWLKLEEHERHIKPETHSEGPTEWRWTISCT